MRIALFNSMKNCYQRDYRIFFCSKKSIHAFLKEYQSYIVVVPRYHLHIFAFFASTKTRHQCIWRWRIKQRDIYCLFLSVAIFSQQQMALRCLILIKHIKQHWFVACDFQGNLNSDPNTASSMMPRSRWQYMQRVLHLSFLP